MKETLFFILQVISFLLAPIIATILGLVVNQTIIRYFDVSLDAPERAGMLINVLILPIAYVVFWGSLAYFLGSKKSYFSILLISQIGFIIISGLWFMWILYPDFYTTMKYYPPA